MTPPKLPKQRHLNAKCSNTWAHGGHSHWNQSIFQGHAPHAGKYMENVIQLPRKEGDSQNVTTFLHIYSQGVGRWSPTLCTLRVSSLCQPSVRKAWGEPKYRGGLSGSSPSYISCDTLGLWRHGALWQEWRKEAHSRKRKGRNYSENSLWLECIPLSPNSVTMCPWYQSLETKPLM